MSALAQETLDKLRRTSSAAIATVLFKRGLHTAAMQGPRLLTRARGVMVGEAFTVRTIPSREDLDRIAAFDGRERPQAKAFDSCPAGSVFVVDCRGETFGAFGGAIFLSRLATRNAGGMVSDGAVRDLAEVANLDLPVFAVGTSPPPSLVNHHVADINVPIGCAGVAVYPGDIVVGDADGVVVVPRQLADEAAAEALEQEHYDLFALEQIRSGKAVFGTYPPDDATRERYAQWLKKSQG